MHDAGGQPKYKKHCVGRRVNSAPKNNNIFVEFKTNGHGVFVIASTHQSVLPLPVDQETRAVF